MIGHSNKQYLKEEAMKARQAQAMQSFSPPITVNATLFHAPRRVEHNSNTGIMGQINKVLGNYNEGVEEIGKRAGHIYEVRPQSRDANNQQKYKVRLNGVNRPTPTPQHNSNSVPSGRGHDSRHSTSDLPQLMQDESSKSFQNSSSSLPSKESEPASSHNRNSQHLRPSSASRQPSEKHATEKDGPSSLPYQHKNKYASSYANFNHKSHPSSSSSSSSSHNHPSGLGSSSGSGGTKSSRPSSSISTDSHHSSKPAGHSSEKHPSSGVPDKHHGNISKTYPDLKAHNEKPHGDARGHATSDGKSSSERTIVHSMLSKGRSLSPPKLKPQSQRQGPPLLQPQQTLQQLPPQLQHQQPPTIIPVTTGSDICDENHHSSPSVSPSSVFNATNNNRVKSLPSQQISKDSSLPENLFSGEDNDVNRIVREMTSQPEKLTAIKTPIKSASLGNKTKPEKDKIVSSSDKTTMPKTLDLKNRSRSDVAKNLHGSNMNNLSSDDADLTEMKDKTELDKIIAEMTCIKSPISIILTPEKIKNSQVPFLKTITSDLAVSDSEGSASDADERRPSDEKPCNGSSSDEEINYNKKQLDFSREKEAITQEVKNHMSRMLSPMLDDEPLNANPLRGQEDLSQDLQMSESDNESIKSEASLSSQHQPPLLTCNSGGFVIPTLSENDSDDEMEGICKNPAADVHNTEVPDEVAATTDPTHFYGTPQVCAPAARKGSRESPHKISDNEESDDDDDDDDDDDSDDDNEEEEEKETKIKSEDDTSAAGSEILQEKEADQGSSSSTSCTESTEDESEGSDEEEGKPHLNPSPPSHPAKPTTEGEHCDSSSSMSWGLRGFITKPLEIKQPKVTDPQTKSESDNCSSKANSNHSSPSNKYSSDDSSSDSSNSFSNQENPSHTCLPTASPDKSPLLSDGEELHDGNDSVKRSSISSSGMDEVTPVSKTEILVSDASTKVTCTTSTSAVTTSTTWSDTTSSTTKVQECLSIKIPKVNLNSASTPTPMPISSLTSSSVERKRKRKVSLPISINLDLLKKRKLSPEPSQPAENVNLVKLEPAPHPQSSSQPRPNAAVDKKIRPPNLQKRGKITNSRRKKSIIVKIDVKLMNLVPKNCKGGLHPSRKSAISKSPAGLASPSATTKTFTSSSNSGVSTPKLAPSKQVSTPEITATTATVTSITPKTTTQPPSLLPPPPTTKVATPPPPSSSSSSTISPNTSMVMATSKTMPPVLVPTSTASTLENDFNFRIPKRNHDSDSQESRMKMVKIDVQSSKSESKTSDLVKADSGKKSDTAAKKSSPLPPPPLEHSFASNKGNKVSKELKLLSTKAGQTCHDNNINPTPSTAVDENSNSKPNSNDKHLPAASITNVSSVSSKDMTKATNASSSNSSPSSSSTVVQSSSASKLSSSSSGTSSAADIADPRLTVPATTSSSLSTSSNSTFTGDSSRSSSSNTSSSNSTSNSKRSSDAIKSGRPPAKVQPATSSKHKSSANSYFQEATRMKHEGNKKTDIFEKSFLYMQSVVYYVQSGIAMEKSRKEQDCQKMFSETLELLGQIGHYHQYQQEQKLSVLRLMLMSAICKKLYDVKRKVAENLRQVLDEHYKQSSSSTSTTNAHTPSPVRPNLNISTPSSRSTPSPSGSIDSIRSQGSSTSDARLTPSATSANSSSSTAAATTTNITSSSMPSSSINPHASSGTSSSSSSSQTLVIPKRIHSITRNYIDIMDYLAKANHYSEQAAIQRDSCKDFIERLNSRCKTISWQSSISEYVEYVKAGLQLLQDS